MPGENEMTEVAIGNTPAKREVYLRQHIESLNCIATKLEDANIGLHSLADRLLGGQQETESKENAKACPEGMISECQDRELLLSNKAEQILAALERLQQIA